MAIELLDTDPRRLAQLSTEELRAELARGLKLTAEHLFRLGQVWLELEGRGEDLSALRKGLAIYLPHIGSGRGDAHAVVRFAGSGLLMRAIAALPIDDQRRLAEGGTVPLVASDGESQAADPLQLSPIEVRRVFVNGRVRSVAEQKELCHRRPYHKTPSASIRALRFLIKGWRGEAKRANAGAERRLKDTKTGSQDRREQEAALLSGHARGLLQAAEQIEKLIADQERTG
jgi:hypothetical protein